MRLSRTGLLPRVKRDRHLSADPQAGGACYMPSRRGVRSMGCRLPSPRPRPFPPRSPPHAPPGLSPGHHGSVRALHRYYEHVRLLVRSPTALSPRLPVAVRDRQKATADQTRSPRFRRVPFRHDLVSDPGGATAPRMTAPHMSPSTIHNASASAMSTISGLNTDPAQIAVYASRWSSPSIPQHSLPGGC